MIKSQAADNYVREPGTGRPPCHCVAADGRSRWPGQLQISTQSYSGKAADPAAWLPRVHGLDGPPATAQPGHSPQPGRQWSESRYAVKVKVVALLSRRIVAFAAARDWARVSFVVSLVARANRMQSFRCKALPLRPPGKGRTRHISRAFCANVRLLRWPGPWPGAQAVTRWWDSDEQWQS